MSGTPPSEEEAPLYRGQSLTPESPRPLHVPSPANIPILEHQIDPIFNLMSTHTEQTAHQPAAATGNAAAEEMDTADSMVLGKPEDVQNTQGAEPEPQQAALPTEPNPENADAADAAAEASTSEGAARMISEVAADAAPTDPQNTSVNPTIPPDARPEGVLDPTPQTDAHMDESDGVNPSQPAAISPPLAIDVAPPNLQALMQSLQSPASLSQLINNAAIDPISAQKPDNLPSLIQNSPPVPSASESSANLPTFPPATHVLDVSNSSIPAAISNVNTSEPRTEGAQMASSDNVAPFTQAATAPAVSMSAQGESTAEIEASWKLFLDEETAFTAEGAWEKFPHGSRLFVGNLPTESVSRREIWDIFHKYGKLAQIAIKQAYGFVQFMDVESCQKAMKAEQGSRIRERNMHLEVSKPPKSSNRNNNSKQNDSKDGQENQKSNGRDRRRDRSRSPTRRNRGSRGGGGSADLRFSDFRDEPRRGRDDYRPGRSPSPRRNDGYRPRDRSADRHYDGRRRSRSPYGRGTLGQRDISPYRSGVNDDDVPLPRRPPRDVPDVQIILAEDVSRQFVQYVVSGFQAKGIRCDVLNMPRIPLEAVIRRQIVEGVIAVCILTRQEERSGNVPLQVFDRSRGTHDVRFDEYDNLAVQIAAELALRAKSQQTPATPSYSGVQNPYSGPYMQQAQQQQQQQQAPQLPPQMLAANPNLQGLISSLDPASLQQLLGVLQQQQQPTLSQQASPTQQGFPGQDMSAILASMTPQQQQQVQSMQRGQPATPTYSYGQAASQQPGGSYTYATVPGSGYPGAPGASLQSASHQYGRPPASSNNVQNIMDQLASIQRKS